MPKSIPTGISDDIAKDCRLLLRHRDKLPIHQRLYYTNDGRGRDHLLLGSFFHRLSAVAGKQLCGRLMHSAASTNFDAYHKWLGILPTEKPAHHYRLLGIALFEGDPEVIGAAADRQMAHVKSFAAGRYSAESQALLNELARARVTLLNAQQKAVYDRGLKQLLANKADAPPRAAEGIAASLTQPAVRQVTANQPRSDGLDRVVHIRARHNKRRRSAPYVSMIAIAVGAFAIGASLYYAAITGPSLVEQAASKPVKVIVPDKNRFDPTQQVERASRGTSQPQPEAPEEPLISPGLSPNVEVEPPREKPELEQSDERRRPRPLLPKIAHVIDLDLKSRRQRYVSKDLTHSQFRVLSLGGSDLPYMIQPKDGNLDRTSEVAITIGGIRDLVIQVSLNAAPQGTASIILECHVINDAGDDVPLTLSNLDRVCRRITKQGQQAASALADMQAEKSRLQAWIAAPVLKSLAERGQARARVLGLDIAISEQSDLVESLRAELRVAEEVEEQAIHLHNDCAIEIAIDE